MKIFNKNGNEINLVDEKDTATFFNLSIDAWNHIEKGTDLNNLKSGTHFCFSDDYITSILNKPSDFSLGIGDEIYLIVIGSSSSFVQFFLGVGANGNALWIRRYSYGGFYSWTRI